MGASFGNFEEKVALEWVALELRTTVGDLGQVPTFDGASRDFFDGISKNPSVTLKI